MDLSDAMVVPAAAGLSTALAERPSKTERIPLASWWVAEAE
jgi:hypothetical protein